MACPYSWSNWGSDVLLALFRRNLNMIKIGSDWSTPMTTKTKPYSIKCSIFHPEHEAPPVNVVDGYFGVAVQMLPQMGDEYIEALFVEIIILVPNRGQYVLMGAELVYVHGQVGQ